MRLSICLLALLLGCNVTAEILHEIVEEKTSATLRCPYSVWGEVTWSRERHGNKVDILTTGDSDKRHNDPGRRHSSLADKSLFIHRVTISDSGRYLCNNGPAVELTVIPSGTIRLDATEGTRVTLTCPHDVGGSVPTWSRGSGDIQQQLKGFYVSPVDNTLTITDVQRRDSGLYYCDGKPAVYLTVIKDTKAPTTLTTRPTPKTRQTSAATPSKTATPPPATTVPSTPPLRTTTSTDTTTTKKRHHNKKNGKNKDKKNGNKTSPPTTTTTTTTTGTYIYHQQLLRLVCGVVVTFLVLVILVIIIIYFTRRCRLKRRERCPVYEEIQDGFVLQPIDAGSKQNDPTYSTIPDLPPVQKKTDTSPPIESPYSMIGNTFTDGNNKGSSELSDNTYFLLEKPKAPGNNKDQYL